MPLTEKGIFLEFPIVVLSPHLILLISPVIFSISLVPRHGSKQATSYFHSSWPNLTPFSTLTITTTSIQNTPQESRRMPLCHHSRPPCPGQGDSAINTLDALSLNGATQSSPCSAPEAGTANHWNWLTVCWTIRWLSDTLWVKEEWFKLKTNLTEN